LVSKYKWQINSKNYVGTTTKDKKRLMLHRLIMNCKSKEERVDHIDRNPLNNQKSNLRYCTITENQRNREAYNTYAGEETTSKYKGVSWYKKRKKWRVQIMVDSEYKELGLFYDEISAARCYNYWAKVYFKEFAVLNDVEEIEESEWRKNEYVPKFYSKYYGVTYDKRGNKWVARTWYDNKRIDVGYFDDELEAARAYDKKVKELKGDKARKLNNV
jgi:hypothetical protein